MEKFTLPKNKVVITVAQTGAMSSKSMNPNVPEQPAEIAASAYDCFNEGAAICHIHARDPEGKPSADIATYQEIHDRIRAKCNMIIQDSTGGGPNLSQEERIQCLKTGPEMASLQYGLSHEGGRTLQRHRLVKHARGDRPLRDPNGQIQHQARDGGVQPRHAGGRAPGHQNRVWSLKPYYVNIVLGMKYQGAEPATPDTLYSIVKSLPPETIFNVTGVGSMQTPSGHHVHHHGRLPAGGHGRQYLLRQGPELAESNAQLVARIVRIARELGKEPATPEEARAYFGLPQLAGVREGTEHLGNQGHKNHRRVGPGHHGTGHRPGIGPGRAIRVEGIRPESGNLSPLRCR